MRKLLILAFIAANSYSIKVATQALPNRIITPGATCEITIAELCRKGFSHDARDVSKALKKAVFTEYGIPWSEHGKYEVDHLCSLELGGSNEQKNLWPQPYTGEWNAHKKDGLENHLHALVCEQNSKVTLADAQNAIIENWIEAYDKYMKIGIGDAKLMKVKLGASHGK